MEQPWHITPDRIREFLSAAAEGIADPEFRARMPRFAAKAIGRALSEEATRKYKVFGYLGRDLRGEPEAEQLDSGNYGCFQWLKDRHEVASGVLDPVKAEESEMWLRNLTARAAELHADWERYWAWRYGAD